MSVVRKALGSEWKWRSLARACCVVLGSGIAAWVLAAPQEPNIDRSPAPDTAETAAIDQLRLSDRLADFGERTADPLALIEAAKISKIAAVPFQRRVKGRR